MGGVAHWNVQFVRRDNAKCRVPKFPPELVPYNNYLYGRRGFWNILDAVNHAGSCQKKDNDDQDWNDGPGQLNLRASIHLGWLTLCARYFAAEFHYDIAQ